MRTPLNSIIFFVEQVLYLLGLLNLVSPEAKQIKLYLDLMLNQLNFVLLFVEDLLDL